MIKARLLRDFRSSDLYLVRLSTKYFFNLEFDTSLNMNSIVLSTALASFFLSSLLKNSCILSCSATVKPSFSISLRALSF
ncbi:hypothetical protein FGO68_gene9178 [Halteria grandinella]|uniref:Uncharacterized protein n=1 Tax=Halteria grandinella TaxID=5974 RepID=A0A8J8P6N4_HALGN|nr:hypothetical protein FGO68_gene9178 [Halteria grandinella]